MNSTFTFFHLGDQRASIGILCRKCSSFQDALFLLLEHSAFLVWLEGEGKSLEFILLGGHAYSLGACWVFRIFPLLSFINPFLSLLQCQTGEETCSYSKPEALNSNAGEDS